MVAVKRFKTQEKSSCQEKRSEEKEQKKCFEEEIVDAPFERNINTVVEKHPISSISSQVVEQIILQVILEVVLSEVSKLIDPVMSMKQVEQRKHNFPEKKELHKTKIGFIINKHREISYQLMNRVMK